MRFKYSAKTKDSYHVKRGEIDAPNKDMAINALRDKGLIVYSLEEIKGGMGLSNLLSQFRGISLNDKIEFTDQLSSMLSAGLPITKSLELLIMQTRNRQMGDAIQQILNEIESGAALSTAMEKQGDTFSKSYMSLIKAGEASGKLETVMKQLATTLKKQREFKSRVKGAMIYPIIITIAMVIVFFLIVIFVIPKMSTIYDSFNVDLPVMTVALITLSDILLSYWWMGIISIVIISFALSAFRKTVEGEYFFSRLALRLPVFGRLVRESAIVEFTRTLGLLEDAGVPIIEGLHIIKNVMGNRLFKDAAGRFVDDVKHGHPLSQSIGKESIFPPLVGQMVVVGEETGTLGERLHSLADYYENEVDKVIKNLSIAIEPVIMILLGIMVGTLIISVIMPIYQLTSNF